MDLECLTPAFERLRLDQHHHPPRRCRSKRWNPNPNPSLRPLNPTAFKKESKKQRRERKRREQQQQQQKQQQSSCAVLNNDFLLSDHRNATVSTAEWPCDPIPAPKPETTGWALAPRWEVPPPNRTAYQSRPPVSSSEQSAARAQQNGMMACRDFFSSSNEDEDEECPEDGGSEALKFFTGLFESDLGLRGFYLENWEKKGFCCLVCGGMGAKPGKRFVYAAGMVQHCASISKTKRVAAHRAFGRAVCRLLGWDFNVLLGKTAGELLCSGADQKEDTQTRGGIIEENPRNEIGEPVVSGNVDLMEY